MVRVWLVLLFFKQVIRSEKGKKGCMLRESVCMYHLSLDGLETKREMFFFLLRGETKQKDFTIQYSYSGLLVKQNGRENEREKREGEREEREGVKTKQKQAQKMGERRLCASFAR